MKKKLAILIIAVLAIGGLSYGGYRMLNQKTQSADGEDVAYVEAVANLADTGALGMNNRYAGTVESQETWSVNKNMDAEVKELKVEVGQEVKTGDPLFVYDTSKYQQDLDQANIDLERMNNEYESLGQTIDQLTKEKAKAPAAQQANYTIQIKEQQLSQEQKALEIESKKQDMVKLQSNIDHATVTCQMDGVIKSINDGNSYSSDQNNNAYITVIKMGDYRVKGTVNEQNVGLLSEGTPVIVHSRVDDKLTWTGTITKVDTQNTVTDTNSMYYGGSSQGGTNYPFYVDLDTSDGLILGQHVYMELDMGMSQVDKSQGIWIGSYMVDMTDADHPFVWAADGKGKLEKRSVTLGESDDMMGEVQITEGLTMDDTLAIPADNLKEGMSTASMSEMPVDYGYEDGGTEDYIIEDGQE